MNKIEISDTIKDYIKKSIKFNLIMSIGYAITEWGIFPLVGLGYCIGAVVCCVRAYSYDKHKQSCLDELEKEVAEQISAQNKENEVKENDE